MFIAKDIDGNIVTIEEAELFKKENPNVKIKYFCPSCKNQVFVKAPKSDKVRTHFAHTKKCSDDWKYDMSEWHRNWQNCFPKECQEVVMSNGVEIHRADVCINNTVIEFQYSSITVEEIEKRNIFYLSLGYPVVWVFDAQNKLMDLQQNIINIQYNITNFTLGYNSLYWKKRNKNFRNFKMFDNYVIVFFEVETSLGNILLHSIPVNDKCIECRIWYRFFKQDNFLKQFGAIKDESVLSLDDIMRETNKNSKIRI